MSLPDTRAGRARRWPRLTAGLALLATALAPATAVAAGPAAASTDATTAQSITATATAAALPDPQPGAEVVYRPADGAFAVTGGGFGHGIGMSQYGARGAAAQGLEHEEILAFYYPGTDLVTEATPNPNVRVGITIDNDGVLEVAAASGLAATVDGTTERLPDGPDRWRVTSKDDGCVLQGRTDGSWERHEVVAGDPCPVSFRTAKAVADSRVPVVLPGGEVRAYRGHVRAVPQNGKLTTVNTVTLQHYLRSVVPSEMPTYFGAEALQAQAVAARTYTRRQMVGKQTAAYDLCDTTACQVYKGSGRVESNGSITPYEYSQTSDAVAATAGQVLMYDFASGRGYATTMYSSSNGGQVAPGGAGHGYLRAKTDPYDGAPGANNGRYSWTGRLPVSVLESRFGLDRLERIQIVRRDGHGTWGGRIGDSQGDVLVEGTKDGRFTSVATTGTALRMSYPWPTNAEGLSSTYFRLTGAWTTVERVAGDDRYGTAVRLSRAAHEPGVEVLYLASGKEFPDALAAAPVAGELGAPLLLTKPGQLPGVTAKEVARLSPGRVVVLGGTSTVATDVEDDLREAGVTRIERVAGDDRYGTAVRLSRAAHEPGVEVLYLASGKEFPDALAAAPVAGELGAPLLLTKPGQLPGVTAKEVARLSPGRVVVLGGTSTVATDVEDDLREAGVTRIQRVAGGNRYGTAVEVSSGHYAPGVDTVYLATGEDFADALAVAPLAGAVGAPVLLTPSAELAPVTARELKRLNPGTVVILGGTSSVSSAVHQSLARNEFRDS